MLTAYKAMKDKLGKGKAAGTAQDNIDRIAAFRKKLGGLDVSVCSADVKITFQQALSELRQDIEGILISLVAPAAYLIEEAVQSPSWHQEALRETRRYFRGIRGMVIRGDDCRDGMKCLRWFFESLKKRPGNRDIRTT